MLSRNEAQMMRSRFSRNSVKSVSKIMLLGASDTDGHSIVGFERNGDLSPIGFGFRIFRSGRWSQEETMLRQIALAVRGTWVGVGLAMFSTLILGMLALAQDQSSYSVHVESNLVLVPVSVYDKDQSQMPLSMRSEGQCILSDRRRFLSLRPSTPYFPVQCDQARITDLTTKDFKVLMDGSEQRVTGALLGSWDIIERDVFGAHAAYSTTPRGVWSGAEIPTTESVAPEIMQYYQLTFDPTVSNKCEPINITVDRPKSIVVQGRTEYCAGQSASDPLNGTSYGKKLEGELDSSKQGSMRVRMEAGFFYGLSGLARTNVVVSFPNHSRSTGANIGSGDGDVPLGQGVDGREITGHVDNEYSTSTKSSSTDYGLLGVLSSKDGRMVVRFSDQCCADFLVPIHYREGQNRVPDFAANISNNPIRFETEFDISPGEYNLRLILDDGDKVGQADMALTVPEYDHKSLGLSSVMLCKRFRDAHVAAVEAAAANFAPQYVPLISKGIQFTPEGDTTFRKGEPLIAYFEVYKPLLKAQPNTTVQAHMKVLDAKSGKLIKDYPPVDAHEYENPGSITIPIARKIPFDEFPKGNYKLEVQATDSAGRSTEWRTAEFTVQ